MNPLAEENTIREEGKNIFILSESRLMAI